MDGLNNIVAQAVIVSGIITTLFGVIVQFRSTRESARIAAARQKMDEELQASRIKREDFDALKQVVELLKEQVKQLTLELENERTHSKRVQRENDWLRFHLSKAGITIPPMPEDWQ